MTRDDLLGTHQAHLAMISATPSHPKPLLVQGADAFVCCPFGKMEGETARQGRVVIPDV
jgi:hypothetical protein